MKCLAAGRLIKPRGEHETGDLARSYSLGRGSGRVGKDPAHLAPEEPGLAGDPPSIAHLILLPQPLPGFGDSFPAEVAQQSGRMLAIDHRQPPDAAPEH